MATFEEGEQEQDQDRPPFVVLVLGWWLSSPRGVQKYADIYASREDVAEVVSVTYQTSELIVDGGHERVLRALKSACDRYHAQFGCEPGVVVHAMSNNGAKALIDLLKAVKRRKRRSKRSSTSSTSSATSFVPDIRGFVLDSMPGELTLRAATGATLASQKLSARTVGGVSGALLGSLVLLLRRTLLQPAVLLSLLLLVLGALYLEKELTRIYHSSLTSLSRGPPKLFMYSQGDDLVAAHAVESVAGAMEAQGDSVALCEFQASPHVAHLRTHRKQYLTAIDDFFRDLDTLTAAVAVGQ